jgi:RimJ/RimL family protein N-acetyltransferase
MPPEGFAVRPISEEELSRWWAVRLRGLREHPDAFGADYETARAEGPGFLVERTFGPSAGVNALLGAFDNSGEIVATTGVLGNRGKRAHIAIIWGVYTVPEARGRGLARRLIDAAIARCRAFPHILQVHIDVNADNAAALHVYESAGFVPWGREPRAIALPDRFDDEIHAPPSSCLGTTSVPSS